MNPDGFDPNLLKISDSLAKTPLVSKQPFRRPAMTLRVKTEITGVPDAASPAAPFCRYS
jgi:hypothetical protein